MLKIYLKIKKVFFDLKGSGLGRSVSDLAKAVPSGNVETDGIAVRGNVSQSRIKEWIEKVSK